MPHNQENERQEQDTSYKESQTICYLVNQLLHLWIYKMSKSETPEIYLWVLSFTISHHILLLYPDYRAENLNCLAQYQYKIKAGKKCNRMKCFKNKQCFFLADPNSTSNPFSSNFWLHNLIKFIYYPCLCHQSPPTMFQSL